MIKKSSIKDRKSIYHPSDFASGIKKRLEIKQIRSYVEKLQNLRSDALLPDWPDLAIGDRFAIVLRLIPTDQRSQVLGKSAVHARRYEKGITDIPLSVVAALAAETEIPLQWIVTGNSMQRGAPMFATGKFHPRFSEEGGPGYVSSEFSETVPVQKLSF